MRWLFPREENFFELFEKQATLLRDGCDQLHEMMVKFDHLEERAKRLKETEHEADLVTHQLYKRLNRTFVTPLEREDIHRLGSGLDDILDSTEAIASRILLFNIQATTEAATRLTGILVASAAQIEMAVSHLRGLKSLSSFTIEVNRLENEADSISRQAVADLFNGRHQVLDVLRWKEIYGRLESAADQCEDVANILEGIVMKAR